MLPKINQKYIIVAVFLLMTVLFSFYMVKTQREKKEIAAMIDYEKQKLEQEYTNWNFQNETTNLTIGNDSLLLLLNQEREKIHYLLERIKVLESSDVRQFNELRKELDATRETARYYIRQVDSLNTINKNLQTENKKIKQRNEEVEVTLQQLSEEKKMLSEKIDLASVLETEDIRIDGLLANGKITASLFRTEKFQCCFRILKNKLTPVGRKEIYLRFTNPENFLFENQEKDTFAYENKNIQFSAHKTIEYGGEDMDICMFWNAKQPMKAGFYRVGIFVDGFLIGEREVMF